MGCTAFGNFGSIIRFANGFLYWRKVGVKPIEKQREDRSSGIHVQTSLIDEGVCTSVKIFNR
jgi:hypothetical protein